MFTLEIETISIGFNYTNEVSLDGRRVV